MPDTRRRRARDRRIAAAIVFALAAAVMAGRPSGFAAVSAGPAPDLTVAIVAADQGQVDPTFGTGGHMYATTVYAAPLTWWQTLSCTLARTCDLYPLDTSAAAQQESTQSMSAALATAAKVAGRWAAPVGRYHPDVLKSLGDVQGASAGLMTALALLDAQSDGDLTAGMTIAGTGTIDVDGRVGRIGGIGHKVAGATTVGASVFFAPAEQANVAAAVAPRGMQVVPVDDLEDALEWLCTHGGASQLCS